MRCDATGDEIKMIIFKGQFFGIGLFECHVIHPLGANVVFGGFQHPGRKVAGNYFCDVWGELEGGMPPAGSYI